mmetsp:Transcript_16362/g.27671  ORF Transcript_16362/g.27671 Transcript_16362/m.27671 type:complete len:225 (-) Transcript_16362:1042-1716(-)
MRLSRSSFDIFSFCWPSYESVLCSCVFSRMGWPTSERYSVTPRVFEASSMNLPLLSLPAIRGCRWFSEFSCSSKWAWTSSLSSEEDSSATSSRWPTSSARGVSSVGTRIFWTRGMKEPNMTVVMMTTARVVVTMTSRSLKLFSGFSLSFWGILSTSPKAMAPLIMPPYEMKLSSRRVTSLFLEQSLKRKWEIQTAMVLPTMMMRVIQPMKETDQMYSTSASSFA